MKKCVAPGHWYIDIYTVKKLNMSEPKKRGDWVVILYGEYLEILPSFQACCQWIKEKKQIGIDMRADYEEAKRRHSDSNRKGN